MNRATSARTADLERPVAARATVDGFRSDINGLRAIAIALVVAFHLAPGQAPGGFVGVDVFFVISGYLMTRLIVGGLEKRRFSLWRFYLARLRRIWPALVGLCAALAVLGSVALDPWTYQRVAKEIPSALLFFSNLVFAVRSGYFEPDARDDWLRHTWSLSLEWQFYLIHPLILLALFARPTLRRRLWLVLAAIAVVSFGVAVVLWLEGSTASFYLLPSRAWETLAGGLCVAAERGLKPGGGWRWPAHLSGLALIVAGAAIATPVAGWPSPIALVPVAGAVLVILSGVTRTLWAETALVDGLGRTSYSIYIWHWPVILALRYAGAPQSPLVDAVAIAAMVGAGIVSYQVIERRLTAWMFARRPWRWMVGLGTAASVLALAFAAAGSQGFAGARTAGFPPDVRKALADARAAAHNWGYPRTCGHFASHGLLDMCQMGDPAARQVVVIGDSHAAQFAPRYANAFGGRPGAGLTFLVRDACMPVPGIGRAHDHGRCGPWARQAFAWARVAGFRRVVVMSSWTAYFDVCPEDAPNCDVISGRIEPAAAGAVFQRLADAVAKLRAAGVEVVLVGPTPRADAATPASVYRHEFWSRAAAAPPIPQSRFAPQARLVEDELAGVAQRTGAVVIEPMRWLCPDGFCPVTANGRALYMDRTHLRADTMSDPRYAFLDPWLAPGTQPPPR